MVKVWVFSQKGLWEQKQGKQPGSCSPCGDPISISAGLEWGAKPEIPCCLKCHQWLPNGWGETFLTKPGYCPQPRRNGWEGKASFPAHNNGTWKAGENFRCAVMWGESSSLVGVLYLQSDVSLVRSKPSHVLAGAMGPYQLKKIKYQFVYKNSQILYKRWL